MQAKTKTRKLIVFGLFCALAIATYVFVTKSPNETAVPPTVDSVKVDSVKVDTTAKVLDTLRKI